MKRINFKVLSIVVVSIILVASLATVLYSATLNGCHKYCAKSYPDVYNEYMACMMGCLNGGGN